MALAAPIPQSRAVFPWPKLAWFGLLLAACYAPILIALVQDWINNPDMGHGLFVPLIAGYIVWQRRQELAETECRPSGMGLLVVAWGACQMLVATLGSELFLARTSFVISIAGAVWMLCGTRMIRKLAFPIFLLFFMVPIPAVIYNSLTFPLQLLASRVAEESLVVLGIPVLREGNILELPNQTLSVVEACSGVRSLLSLTFFALVYGYFFEKKAWIRVLLFAMTIPIALIANGGRVTITAILGQVNPELAEGVFHESTGLVIFLLAVLMLFVVHRTILVARKLAARRGLIQA